MRDERRKRTKAYLKRRASRSHSNKHKISFSRTGPLILRIILRVGSSMNSTRTWVTLPVLPVRPRTLITRTSLVGWSYLISHIRLFQQSWMHTQVSYHDSRCRWVLERNYFSTPRKAKLSSALKNKIQSLEDSVQVRLK
jgi:hypothetical protein